LTLRSSLEKFCRFIDKEIVLKNITKGFQKIILTIDCGNNDREFLRELLRLYSVDFQKRSEYNINDSVVKIVLL
jgi:hypothetical protein